jgi:hypothetical protein
MATYDTLRVVLDDLLTPANDIRAGGASRGGVWMGIDMTRGRFKERGF